MKGKTPTLDSLFVAKSHDKNEGLAMPPGMATVSSQHERHINNDDDLHRAMALSAAEARLASMSEEQRIEAAIAESLAAEQDAQSKLEEVEAAEATSSRKPSPNFSTAKRKADELGEEDDKARVKARRDVHALFAATKESQDRIQKTPLSMISLGADVFDERQERVIDRLQGSLDLLFCKGWMKKQARTQLREWMLAELAWHRVTYVRPGTNMRIVTPRFTATFGKDDTGAPDSAYRVVPKPFPAVLASLRDTLQTKTSARFNAIIINYYADGQDSISYHSDDEAFLGPKPTIASVSLGASRDFYLRRKAPAHEPVPVPNDWQKMGTKGKGPAATRPTEKMTLDDGDLLVMRGNTQAEWEHSIPKRTKHVAGRINMTFRRVINVSGTNNFIRYNRTGDDDSGPYRWNAQLRKMVRGVGGL